ncbi:MAG: phage tail protein [Alphaproteobacteria bacterium]|nr:phage tail protein [Alphaproteobacteria bacterium]
MTALFLPNVPPSRTTRMATRHPVREIRFGGGHTRYVRDGAASAETTWTVHWNGLPPAQAATLAGFLDAQQGITPFLWTPPSGAVPEQFICREWTITPLLSGHQNINAVFIRQH